MVRETPRGVPPCHLLPEKWAASPSPAQGQGTKRLAGGLPGKTCGKASPHSPADRATPAVAKLPLPRGPGKSSEYVGSQVTKGPGGPTPIPALLTHVQERGHHEILPGGTGRLPEDPQSHTSGHTHPQLFKIPPFLLFSCLPCTPTNCHAQA